MRFTLTPTRSNSISQVKAQGHRRKNAAKVVGVISTDGFSSQAIHLQLTFTSLIVTVKQK